MNLLEAKIAMQVLCNFPEAQCPIVYPCLNKQCIECTFLKVAEKEAHFSYVCIKAHLNMI